MKDTQEVQTDIETVSVSIGSRNVNRKPKKVNELSKNFKRSIPIFLLFPLCFMAGFYSGKKNQNFGVITEGAYSIGIYKGHDPFSLSPDPKIHNPVMSAEMVSDVPALFVADPFLINNKDKWYLFFEVLNRKTNKGDIGLAVSDDTKKWKYDRIVLDEPFHLSYPYVFKWKDDYYMLPESNAAYSIRLYKAQEFPYKWRFIKELIKGDYSDPSIIHYGNYWWIFTSDRIDMMHLFYAKNLEGPWFAHSKNPIIFGNPEIARPGGRVIEYNGNLIRFTQGCVPIYGSNVKAMIIKKITPDEYSEIPYQGNPILKGSGHGWNRYRMHHCDPHNITDNEWIASVDGVSNKVRFGIK